MDSLHPSLSQALPIRGYDAEQGLQAPFRAAALGIATFYKRAAENGRRAYSLGYSSALQDVLEYLQAGLDHGSDHSTKPQRSEQRMALTIERVMDYIERRQEALRADSLDSGEDDAPQLPPQPQPPSSSATPRHQHQKPTLTTAPPPNLQRLGQLHAAESHPQPAAQASDRLSSNPPEPVSSSPPLTSQERLALPSSHVPTPRRNTPRRTTPEVRSSQLADSPGTPPQVPRLPVEQSSDPARESGVPPSSVATTLNLVSHRPINLDFISFAPTPLPQHPHPASHSNSGRRHRGLNLGEPRKGKAKERGGSTGLLDRERTPTMMTAGSVPFQTMSPVGYSHYGPTHHPPSGSNNDGVGPRGTGIASIGSKRRYPALESMGSPLEPPPTGLLRPSRKSNHKNNNSLVEEVRRDCSNDDVMMVLAGDEESSERPSKRSSRRAGGAGH